MSTKSFRINRRKLLQIITGGFVLGSIGTSFYFWQRRRKYKFSGKLLGPDGESGHRLRDGMALPPTKFNSKKVVIVGGGISGLCAGWWLKKNNFNDFVILEMDNDVGGNSRSSENSISRYPWGAHYIPIPSEDSNLVREIFEDFGVIKGYENGLPIYNEFYLCADPNERIFYQGKWREGVIPQYGLTADEKKQYQEFFTYVEQLKNKKGKDGKTIFSIPLDQSSKDSEYLALDKISMHQFMVSKGWTSKSLNWYVNYSCRDDYGAPMTEVSAWVGLHYFASRAGASANATSHDVLTWPEGNGWIVNQLRDFLGSHIQTQSMVYKIDTLSDACLINYLNTKSQEAIQFDAQFCIFSSPRYIASKIISNLPIEMHSDSQFYPWLVANITLNQKPEGEGVPLAWDNVSYYSPSLGYIVATHQDLKINRKETVITYYLPLDSLKAKESRKSAYNKSHQDWLDIVVPDLEKLHPNISQHIQNIDFWLWAHGMVSPGIDFLWSQKRKNLLKNFNNIYFAHSDMSGISIFEEAQYRGVEAAKKILNQMG